MQLDPPGALPLGVAEEVAVAAGVQMGGDQRRVVHADQAGGSQSISEITIGVVMGAEERRGEADSPAVVPAQGDVARPELVENAGLAPLDGSQVGKVLGCVEAGTGALAHPGDCDRHRPHHYEPDGTLVVRQVTTDSSRGGDDVVVQQDHHFPSRQADSLVESGQLPSMPQPDRAQFGPSPRQGPKGIQRLVIGPVDHHDQLTGRRIAQHGIDEGRQSCCTADGCDHHGCATAVRSAGVAGAIKRRLESGQRGVQGGGVHFIAWGAVAGRSEEIAGALGGSARCVFPPGSRRPPVFVRWILSALVTAGHVLKHRPSVIIVTNPPCPAALIGWFTGRIVGARVVLDSHPGAFGAQGDRVAARMQPLHRWVSKRADLSMVASPKWRDIVESWGGRAVVVHEAPGTWECRPPARHDRLRVLYVGRFAADEPWRAVVDAAADVPEVDVLMTGDPRGVGIHAGALPANVTLVGFLDQGSYREAVYDADVVISLTTEPGSVMRAACEAVWAGRPLVVTDWPAGRAAFPYAVHVDNNAPSLAAGIRRAQSLYEDLATDAPAARREQADRWEHQLEELVEHLVG